uniref:Putative triacylglycerol lipase n=1 Tax=Crangon crangon TaxID=491138 RepID=A0A2Z4BXR8_CRACN|nr:putative triacylglycerol lipase [Crangon crangon]
MKLWNSLILLVMVTSSLIPKTTGYPQRSSRQASFLSTLITSLLRPNEDNIVVEDTADLARMAGYAVERHTVITEDGYILTVHHIPPFGRRRRRAVDFSNFRINITTSPINYDNKPTGISRDEENDNDKEYPSNQQRKDPKVVFLQHGLMGSSDNWNTNTKEDSLAYLLSDDGYDVWMGNIRGNIYSRKHKNLTYEDPQFWKFSYDEMAKYDLPAMLDYVLDKTGVEKLHYVGHSMGTTVFFALMSSQPEYQRRIASMVALAPVATVTSISSPIKYLAPLVNELQFMLRLFGNDEELMTNRLLTSLWDPYKACSNQAICENLQFMITGFDPSRADQRMVPIILTHNPAGSSTQTLFHFAQGFSSGRFQQFDWGKSLNMKNYGQETPPQYNVTNIKVPITLFWANNDWLTSQKDINHLEKQLPHLRRSYKVSNPAFSHLDFLWATDARALVYENIFEALQESP